MRILIIEDDELLRAQLGRRLRREGYDVDEAEDGAVGLQRFEATRADLVITDLVMPNREGLETISALRAEAPNLPIIAMSGGVRGTQDFLRIAKMMGAAAAFSKPFELEDLLAKIRELLEGASPS